MHRIFSKHRVAIDVRVRDIEDFKYLDHHVGVRQNSILQEPVGISHVLCKTKMMWKIKNIT